MGTKLRVWWPDDKEYYKCVVKAHRPTNNGGASGYNYELQYDDGEYENVDLSKEKFQIIGGKKRQQKQQNPEDGDDDEEETNVSSSGGDKKKRRILEDSEEEEMEFDMDSSSDEEEEGDDSASEYKMKGDESSMDDESLNAVSEKEGLSEDDWLASEDDEDEAPKKKKKKTVKKVTITRVNGGSKKSGDSGEGSFVSPTPMKTSSEVAAQQKQQKKKSLPSAKKHDFDQFISQSPKDEGLANSSTKKPSSSRPTSHSSKEPSPMPSNNAKHQKANIPKPIAGVVNAAGTHTHNHLKFFTTNKKDIHRNPVGHPDYSPRTLYVDFKELAQSQDNGKVSPAQKQWWDIKSQYADTVLLFKTGKFYEMFHDDADVGVSVLGHAYMKGQAAHSGFPEAAYSKFVNILVEAGYKVARVEQTETPDAMQERKKKTAKGQPKPQVVCREVCSIVSRGTRTFCFLDDVTLLEKGEVNTGPLLSIKEILIEDNDQDGMGVDKEDDDGDEGGTKAVCEYGVTIVDAVTGVVTLGQFADDILRSRLQTLLASFGPSEVSLTLDQ